VSTKVLRSKVKRTVDRLSDDKLLTVADFVNYLAGPRNQEDLDTLLKIARMQRRLAKAEREFQQGKGVEWRKLRRRYAQD
jgi:hypothetical protein